MTQGNPMVSSAVMETISNLNGQIRELKEKLRIADTEEVIGRITTCEAIYQALLDLGLERAADEVDRLCIGYRKDLEALRGALM